MVAWLNRVIINTPRNATATHTVDPATSTTVFSGTSFAPTAGRFLLCVCEGAVTSTTPAGWTLPTNGSAINNSGLYIWYRTAAGGDTFTTTHNGTNYPVGFAFYEFAAGTTFVKAATATGAALTSNGPTLASMTGTYLAMSAIGRGLNTVACTSSWTAPPVEDFDTAIILASATDGYHLDVAYEEAVVASSWVPASVTTAAAGAPTTLERLSWALTIPAGGPVTYAMLRPAVVAP